MILPSVLTQRFMFLITNMTFVMKTEVNYYALWVTDYLMDISYFQNCRFSLIY